MTDAERSISQLIVTFLQERDKDIDGDLSGYSRTNDYVCADARG
jgi:hypothetical protein